MWIWYVSEVLLLVLGYLLWIAVGATIFIGLFQTAAFRRVRVLFYRGMLNAMASALALAVAGTVIVFALGSDWPDLRDVLAATALSFATNVTFLVLFPVTLDRSVTIFLLGQLSRRDEVSLGELSLLMHSLYVDEYGAVERRVGEQETSGNVECVAAGVRLTPQGQRLLVAMRVIGRLFRADPRFLEPRAARE